MENLKMIMTGPSHVVRLEEAIKYRQIPNLLNLKFVARGGEPLWSLFFENTYKKNEEKFLMVGDFRFGNKILVEEKPYNNIEKMLINPENDKLMYEKTIDYLRSLIKEDVYLLFYDLACRESKNRKSNMYIDNKEYCHPTWNLNIVENLFKDNSVSLKPIVDNGQIESVYMDSSNHPTIVGYILIYIICLLLERGEKPSKINILEVFTNAVDVCMKIQVNLPPVNSKKVIGDSIAERYIRYYQDKEILQKKYYSSKVPLSEITSFSNNHDATLIYLTDIVYLGNSDAYGSQIERLKKQFDTVKNIKCIFWKAWAMEVNKSRGLSFMSEKNYLFTYKAIEDIFIPYIISMPKIGSDDSYSLVEPTVDCQPTFKALLFFYYCDKMNFKEFTFFYEKYFGYIKELKL